MPKLLASRLMLLFLVTASSAACASAVSGAHDAVAVESPPSLVAVNQGIASTTTSSFTLDVPDARVLAVTDEHLWVGTWRGSLLRFSLETLSNDHIVKDALHTRASTLRLVAVGRILVVIDDLAITTRDSITGALIERFEVDDHSSLQIHDVDGAIHFLVPHAQGEVAGVRRVNRENGRIERVEKIPPSALVISTDESGAKDITFRTSDGRLHQAPLFRSGIDVTARVIGDVAVVFSYSRPGSPDDKVLELPLDFALLPLAASSSRKLPGHYAKYLFDAGSAIWIGSHMLSGPLIFTLVDKRSLEILASAVTRGDAQGGCSIPDVSAGGVNALAFIDGGADCRLRIRLLRVSRSFKD